MILDETYQFLKTSYKEQFDTLTIADVRIGVHLSAVKLSDGSYGMAGTVSDTESHCVKSKRDFDVFSPTKITGRKIVELFETPKSNGVISTLRIAALNAISSTLLEKGGYTIIPDKDPIDLVDLAQEKTITIVGAFQSYIQKISETRNRLFVLELNESCLTEPHKKYYVPAEEFSKVIPGSDIVIITGLTLVNNTIDGLLSSVSAGTQLIVTGPSSSIIPDILFNNKVNIVGCTRITDPDLLFSVVSESGAGYHLFRYGAQKICILNKGPRF